MTARRRDALILATMLLGCWTCGGGGGGDGGSPAHVPAATELIGSYDVTTQAAGGSASSESVGAIDAGDSEVRLTLVEHGQLNVHGVLDNDGTVDLEGFGFASDVGFEVHGSARVEERAGMFRVTGTLQGMGTFDFTMERPHAADLQAFRGRYRLRFPTSPSTCQCATTVEVFLDVAADGTATKSAGTEHDAAGTAVAAFQASPCLVSPQGRIFCTTPYETPPGDGCAPVVSGFGPCALTLTGKLSPPDNGSPSAAQFVLAEPMLNVPIGGGDLTIVRLTGGG